jgi:2-polyprenyl-6-hydroxyphenyl methylase / 3-demethylubiquinone-9 3-methyltransferase
MGADNSIYDRDAEHWWSGQGHLSLLRSMIPARLDYLRSIATAQDWPDVSGCRVLDLGCGGGLFSEALHEMGCQVTGIDPSGRSITAALEHASAQGYGIRYEVGRGESLPFEPASFDIVACCDVLEHVDDVTAVIRETARVLRSGGVFLYDTINRNWVSRFALVTLFEGWLKLVPPGLHDSDAFIRPAEMRKHLEVGGLQHGGMVGLTTAMGPIVSLRRLLHLRRVRQGTMSFAEFGEGMVFRAGGPTVANYMGYALREAASSRTNDKVGARLERRGEEP